MHFHNHRRDSFETRKDIERVFLRLRRAFNRTVKNPQFRQPFVETAHSLNYDGRNHIEGCGVPMLIQQIAIVADYDELRAR